MCFYIHVFHIIYHFSILLSLHLLVRTSSNFRFFRYFRDRIKFKIDYKFTRRAVTWRNFVLTAFRRPYRKSKARTRRVRGCMNLIATAGPPSSSTPFDILTTSPGTTWPRFNQPRATYHTSPRPVRLTYEPHPIIPDAIWTGNFAMRCMKIEPKL